MDNETGLRDLLTYLGCRDAEVLGRLAEHTELAGAWAAHEHPADLAWLATRIANDWRERMQIVRVLGEVLDLVVPADTPSRGVVDATMALAEASLIEYPSVPRRDAFVEIKAKEAEARATLVRVERATQGSQGPLPERVVAAGLEASALMLAGGWKNKAADAAYRAVAGAEHLKPDARPLFLSILRQLPFTEFRTAWWTAKPPPAPTATRRAG